MSNTPRFTTADTVMIQRHVRLALQNIEVDPTKPARYGITCQQAYDILADRLDGVSQRWPAGHDVGECGRLKPIKGSNICSTPKASLPTRVPCTVHKEKVFTFSDGTVWRACSAEDCMWGKGRAKHSDGLSVVIPEESDELEEISEISADDPRELSVEELQSKIDITTEVPEQEVGVIEDTEDTEQILNVLSEVESNDESTD